MTHHRRHHRYRSSKKRRNSKNIMNKTINQTVSIAKSTSKKYMPKVKNSIENVGSHVIKSGEQSIPYLQKMTRKFFGKFGIGTKKNRRR